jgi:hypothetical protein
MINEDKLVHFIGKIYKMIYDYNCSLSFTKEDGLIYFIMLADKLFGAFNNVQANAQASRIRMLADKLLEELKLNDEKGEPLKHVEDLDEWFEERCSSTGRVFDINVHTFSLKDELAVVMYECFEDEQGLWNTDLSKELSFKLKLTDYINSYKGI